MKRYDLIVYFDSELIYRGVKAECEEKAIDIVRNRLIKNFQKMKFTKVDIKVLIERGKNVRK
jgi:hypothetical protein